MTGRAFQLGLPVMALPASLEQSAVAARASETGACIGADPRNIAAIGRALGQMICDEAVLDAAEGLAEQYAGFDPDQAAIALADQLIA